MGLEPVAIYRVSRPRKPNGGEALNRRLIGVAGALPLDKDASLHLRDHRRSGPRIDPRAAIVEEECGTACLRMQTHLGIVAEPPDESR